MYWSAVFIFLDRMPEWSSRYIYNTMVTSNATFSFIRFNSTALTSHCSMYINANWNRKYVSCQKLEKHEKNCVTVCWILKYFWYDTSKKWWWHRMNRKRNLSNLNTDRNVDSKTDWVYLVVADFNQNIKTHSGWGDQIWLFWVQYFVLVMH